MTSGRKFVKPNGDIVLTTGVDAEHDAGELLVTDAEAGALAFVTGSDAATTGQALVDIPGLSMRLAANSTYEFSAKVKALVSADATGIQYGINFTGTTTLLSVMAKGQTTAGGVGQGATNTVGAAMATAFFTTASLNGLVNIEGFIVTGATDGVLSVQQLKVTSGTATAKVGSFLRVRKCST